MDFPKRTEPFPSNKGRLWSKPANKKVQPRRSLSFPLAVIAILIFAAICQYLVFAEGLYTKSADESARVLQAYKWSQQKFSVPIGVWLPVYQIFIGLGLKIWPDLMITPRLLNNTIGLLTLLGLGGLAAILFKRRPVTLLTLFLGAVFGPRIVCSVVPFSEILFTFFLIGGLIYFARWIDQPNSVWLLIAAVFTTLAAGVRYEGWLFVAGMGLISIIIIFKQKATPSKQRLSLAMGTCAILCVVPVTWTILLLVSRHNLMEVFTASGQLYAKTGTQLHSFSALWKHGLFYQFFIQNLESLNIFGAFSFIAFGVNNRRLRKWLFLPVSVFVALGIFALVGVAVPAHNFWRTSLIWSFLLIPFSSYWIIDQGKHLSQERKFPALLISLLLVSIFFLCFYGQTVKMSKYSNMDKPDIQVGKFVNSYIKPFPESKRPRIFIEWGGWHFIHVKVVSQCPNVFLNFNSLNRLMKNNQIDVAKLRKHNITLLIVEMNTYAPRRFLFKEFKLAHKNSRWVILGLKN